MQAEPGARPLALMDYRLWSPYTLNPEPCTLNPKPGTGNPKPQTLNPKP